MAIQHDEAEFLVTNNRRLKQATKRLNKELARVKLEFGKDKIATIKEKKVEIKHWRKLLGNERSKKIKFERKLATIESSKTLATQEEESSIPALNHVDDSKIVEDAHDETCSICMRLIPNYIPRYSSGLLWNPACSDCDDDNDDDNFDDNEDDFAQELPPHHYGEHGEVIID